MTREQKARGAWAPASQDDLEHMEFIDAVTARQAGHFCEFGWRTRKTNTAAEVTRDELENGSTVRVVSGPSVPRSTGTVA
jgi:hypothetical protein